MDYNLYKRYIYLKCASDWGCAFLLFVITTNKRKLLYENHNTLKSIKRLYNIDGKNLMVIKFFTNEYKKYLRVIIV